MHILFVLVQPGNGLLRRTVNRLGQHTLRCFLVFRRVHRLIIGGGGGGGGGGEITRKKNVIFFSS